MVRRLSEVVKLFNTHKTGKVCSEGVFRVGRDSLPRGGLIDLMLNVSAKVGKASMALTGSSFDVSDHAPYDRLAWRVKPGTKDVEIRVLVYGDRNDAAGDLDTISEIVWAGVEQLALQTVSNNTV
jgi:hypothetical protein